MRGWGGRKYICHIVGRKHLIFVLQRCSGVIDCYWFYSKYIEGMCLRFTLYGDN